MRKNVTLNLILTIVIVAGLLTPATAQAASPPTGVSASDGTFTNMVRISWDSVPEADFYEVWRAPTASGTYYFLASTGSTTYDDTTAEPGTVYYYGVKSVEGGVPSYLSDVDSGWHLAPPENVSASDGNYSNRVHVTWDPVTVADSYEVWRAFTSYGPYSFLASADSNTYDDTSAAPATVYHYGVKAVANGLVSFMGSFDSGWCGYRVYLPAVIKQ